jgi:hypothetical protein
MATINHETVVALTMRQLIGGLAALLVGGGAVLWTVMAFTVGGVRDDVSAIRNDVGELHKSATETPEKLRESQEALSKEISDLRVDLSNFHGDLKMVQATVDDLKTQVVDLKKSPTRKTEWEFTPQDAENVMRAAVKAGFDKSNVVVVPVGARTDKPSP